MLEIRYQKRLSMLLLQSARDEINIVDREAIRGITKMAAEKGVSDKEVEDGWIEITYRFVPRLERVWPELEG